ncbi:MAG TPA: ABC transporter permease [Chryseosolibacter sp.]
MSNRNSIQPPQWPVKVLRRFVKDEYLEEIEGDMEELFLFNVEEKSLSKARWIYTIEMLQLLRPVLLKNFKSSPTFNQYAMFKNYFKIAWRNLVKKTAYSAINIFGLALGIACCLLIFLFVQDELSYDNYHEKGQRIYRVTHGWKESEEKGAKSSYPHWVWGNAPIGPAMKNEFPEIEKVVQFSGRADILLTYKDKMYQEEGIFFMDSTVFDVFSWPLLKGNPKTALADPFSIVLSESTARKYFGDEDPIGKTFKSTGSAGRGNAGDYTVTGVMKEIPSNSHFKFDVLVSLNTFRKSVPEVFDAWGYVDFYTYFLVNENFDEASFRKKLPDFAERVNKDKHYVLEVEPLKDAYLRTTAERQPGETGSLPNLYVFSIVGLFILVIAIINFMNLSTARSMERGKEVGIRKSIGADRGSLISQFLGESFVIVFFSVIVAVIIAYATLPYMVNFTGKELGLESVLTWKGVLTFVCAMVVVGLIAGSYPAFVLSSFNPVLILKGIKRSHSGGVNLRRALVVFQFTLSIALIAGTIIVYFQMNFLLDKDLGFDREQMVVLDYNYDGSVTDKSEALKSEMERNPGVVSVAFSRSVPGSYYPHAYTEIENPEGKVEGKAQPIFQVGLDFIDHFNMKLVAGRSYSRKYPTDSARALVVNEAAAKQYGYTNPADIIGKKFSQWGREGEVIGVVRDFHFTSLHRNIEPLTLPFEAYSSRYVTVKIRPENVNETIASLEHVWKQIVPQRPFLYSFLDDTFNRQYKADFIFRRLFTTFSCLAIFIACLGLLGLATYTAQQRTKEIGIRKVLGADMKSIVGLLSRDFVVLVLISIGIATPVAWYAMTRWLEGFAYRMEISPWTFVLAGASAVLIALLTITYQSVKAALVNPVSSLRSE